MTALEIAAAMVLNLILLALEAGKQLISQIRKFTAVKKAVAAPAYSPRFH